jgi:basic amino acid/polyamine antiporter, APA family
MSLINDLLRRKDISKAIIDNGSEHNLVKTLGLRDLVSFGIAAIIGAGIFSTIGLASYNGGPAVSLLFIFVAIACVFTALCYAQFASMVPVSGSAYTYAYVSFGELFAWIIGWALILEYAVSNMVVAISWSEYFTSMLSGFGINWPGWLSMDIFTAKKAVADYNLAESKGTLESLSKIVLRDAQAYLSAPKIGDFRIIIDLPAGLITLFITYLVYIGIKESKNASNFLVLVKMAVVLLIIIVGAFYIKPANWSPFAPNGLEGVLGGVASVFFAFIGFDSISTTAEECKDPQRDLPRAMIITLIICTVLYVAIVLVLTGMVSYKELNVADPLAYVFSLVKLDFVAGIISVSAVVAITSALLVYQLGQPRIWMAMSRDGLMGPMFKKIHPKYKTPSFSTIITGLLVGIPALFLDLKFFVDLTSVGTFFAFILVCAGILYLDYTGESKNAKFKITYINGQYLIGLLFILAIGYLIYSGSFLQTLEAKPLNIVFWLVWLVLSIGSIKFKFSVLPVCGILTNLYLMSELGSSNWAMFLIWLTAGLFIYDVYGRNNSILVKKGEKTSLSSTTIALKFILYFTIIICLVKREYIWGFIGGLFNIQ